MAIENINYTEAKNRLHPNPQNFSNDENFPTLPQPQASTSELQPNKLRFSTGLSEHSYSSILRKSTPITFTSVTMDLGSSPSDLSNNLRSSKYDTQESSTDVLSNNIDHSINSPFIFNNEFYTNIMLTLTKTFERIFESHIKDINEKLNSILLHKNNASTSSVELSQPEK